MMFDKLFNSLILDNFLTYNRLLDADKFCINNRRKAIKGNKLACSE